MASSLCSPTWYGSTENAVTPNNCRKQAQQAAIEPRCFPIAEGVIKVEAHLGALEQRERFDISHRYAVFEKQAGREARSGRRRSGGTPKRQISTPRPAAAHSTLARSGQVKP